ncbi:hypothetical protein [Microterricola gilva]|nr:hypothetical protein [Microterricola gilva]
MPEQRPFQSYLRGAAFRTAATGHHGLTPGRLRSRELDAPFHGVRTLGIRADNVFDRCLSYEPLLARNHVFCAQTAAALLGLPLPRSLRADTRLHVGALGGQGPRRAGVIGHRLPIDTPCADSVGGFTVTDAASTWCQLAAALSREELTAAGDFILSGIRRPGGGRSDALAQLEELRAAVSRHGAGRGATALRWALEHVRVGVDSPQETRLRLALVAHGFAEPVIGFPVAVDHGTLTLHPDLAWPDLRLAIEYEGDEHRESKRRFRADIRRREKFEAAGWRVIRVTADDLGEELRAFITRVRAIVAGRRAELAR